MTEADWLACPEPGPMLAFLRGKASDRKLRLFACACARRVLDLMSSRSVCQKTVEFAERFADGLASRNDLHGRAWGDPGEAFAVVFWDAWEAAETAAEFGAGSVVRAASGNGWAEWEAAFDNAWLLEGRPMAEARARADEAMPPQWVERNRLARDVERAAQVALLCDIFGNPFRSVSFDPCWRTADVFALANAIYEDRAFERLPVLADVLMDAECEDEAIIGHCRGEGPHVRGCWVVDFVLRKT